MSTFNIKKINLVGEWSWDIKNNICGICKNDNTQNCNKCYENEKSYNCYSVAGICEHCFHFHCINEWLSSSNTKKCPLCNSKWQYKKEKAHIKKKVEKKFSQEIYIPGSSIKINSRYWESIDNQYTEPIRTNNDLQNTRRQRSLQLLDLINDTENNNNSNNSNDLQNISRFRPTIRSISRVYNPNDLDDSSESDNSDDELFS